MVFNLSVIVQELLPGGTSYAGAIRPLWCCIGMRAVEANVVRCGSLLSSAFAENQLFFATAICC